MCICSVYEIIKGYFKRRKEEREQKILEQEEIISIISSVEPIEAIY